MASGSNKQSAQSLARFNRYRMDVSNKKHTSDRIQCEQIGSEAAAVRASPLRFNYICSSSQALASFLCVLKIVLSTP